mgnify:CR=1 FL=1
MELTDILALVKAGYTRDEIAQMENTVPGNADTVPVSEPVQNTEPEAEPTAVQAQVTEPVAKPVAQPTQAEPSMADIMQSIAKLTSAVQANAIAQSIIPGGAISKPTAEDVFAEIISPTIKERS